MKKLFIALLLGLVMFPTSTLAADFRSSSTGSANIQRGENVENLYAAGPTVRQSADVKGDSILAGANVFVEGSVGNSLAAAGGNINVDDQIGNNARLAGGNIIVSSQIGQDLLAAGGVVIIGNQARILGSAYLTAGTLEFNGRIDGDLVAKNLGRTVISGTVNGDVRLTNVSDLNVTDSAIINGKLIYSSPSEATISDQAQITGGIEFNETRGGQTDRTSNLLTAALLSILISFITLLVLFYVFKRQSHVYLTTSYSKPWVSFGIGFLVLILIPFIILLLFMTIIGALLGVVLALLYALALIIASIYIPLLVGSFILSWNSWRDPRADWLAILLGVVVVYLISLIPFLGQIILFLLFLISLGSIFLSIWDYYRKDNHERRIKTETVDKI